MSEPQSLPPDQHEIEAYRLCFEAKHHYDKLSWQIGTISLVFVGVLLSFIPQIKETSTILFTICGMAIKVVWIKRLILWAFIVVFLFLWLKLYHRNRIWAEAANEKARDFERKWRLEGVALKFMKVNQPNKVPGERPVVTMRNLDEEGKQWSQPHMEHGPRIPLHTVISILFWATLTLGLLACFIP